LLVGVVMSSDARNPKPNGDQSGTSVKDPMLVGILFAVLAVFLTIMYFYIRNTKRGRYILIVGPTESGKTALFARLGFGKNVESVTSTSPNVTEYEVPGKAPLILKDLPGHEKLRMQFWDSNKVGVRGIIFLVDAAGGSKCIRDAAEVLYDILTDPIVNSVKPFILIIANKQDLPTAKGTKVLRLHLEREITTLRLTKSASLQTTGGKSSAPRTLGKPDVDFDFDHLHPIKVEFCEGATNSDESELKLVTNWLEKIA